jgi:hypothetical protein
MHRRSLLAGGLALMAGTAVGACAEPAEPDRGSPDLVALDTAARLESALAQAAAAVAPATSATRAAAQAHRTHVEALVTAGALQPSLETASAVPSARTSAPTTASATAVGPDPARLLQADTPPALAQAQRWVADAIASLALPSSATIAPLLGSIAASDAAHAAVVGGSEA